VDKPEDPTREGYAFQGWFDDVEGGTAYAWPHTLSVGLTMHAQWAAVSYTITYALNRGINSPANPAAYTVESPAIILAEPSRSGYAFGGWYESEDLSGSPVTGIPAGGAGDKTFRAKWIETGSGGITFVIGDFTLGDPADAALNETPLVLSKTGAGGKPHSVPVGISGADDPAQAVWYVGAAEIGTGESVTLDAAPLSLGPHTLRVTAPFGGVRHSKEITFTVEA
jgi:uncharacterized repeat protein (TIGR02543 family)